MLSFRSLVILAALVGCSSRETTSSPDASVATSPLTTLARFDAFRAHIRPNAPSVARAGGLRRVSSIEATLPTAANGPLTISSSLRPGFTVTIATDDREVAGRSEGNAVVYERARDHVDVIDVVEPDRVEEVRLLHAGAPTSFTYSLQLGPAVASVRVIDHRVELLDASGAVGLATEPLFVVDANGVRRDVDAKLEGHGATRTLELSFDPQGLAHPIALDPAWMASAATVPAIAEPLMLPNADGRLLFFAPVTPRVTAVDASKQTTATMPATLYAKASMTGVVLSSGSMLLVGGGTTAELYNPSSGGVATGDLSGYRANQPITRVASPERVYMIGGYAPGGVYYTTAAAFDVGSNAWIPRAPLTTARAYHTQTLLPGNKILVAGGGTSGTDYSSSLIYDVATDTYAAGPNLAATRSFHTATTLDDGRVLVAGGRVVSGNPASTAEVYNGSAFVSVGAMAYQRQQHLAFKMKDGKVIVVGGWGRLAGGSSDTILSTTEIFDPTSNTWSPGPSLAAPRYEHTGVALPDGRIVIAGGRPTTGGATGSIEIFVPDAATCTTSGAGCPNCVDGYCCNTACTGQCEACDVPSYLGICVPVVGQPPHGTRPSCSPFLNCGTGGTCAATCVSDTACATGSYCTGTSCATKKANGVACGASNECTSNLCVDGVCCDSACTSQCQACNVTGSVGTCTNVSGPPVAPRTGCTPGYICSAGACVSSCTTDAQCASTHYCDGGNCVARKADGSTCATSSECTSTFCVDGYCCNSPCTGSCQACDNTTKGTCSNVPAGAPHGTRTCSPGRLCLSTGACSSACTTGADCGSGFICVTGVCIAQKLNGSSCIVGTECSSGNCVNGLCCDRPCFGECESCRLSGFVGTCKPQSTAAKCGPNGCSGSYLVTPGNCSGVDNTCVATTITPCPNNLTCKDTLICNEACTSDAQCKPGYVCNAGSCVPSADAGAPDTGAPDTAVSDTGATGDALPIADAPAPQLPATPVVNGDFIRCTKDSECSTNHCVEGVCCDTACTDRCYSCALLSNPGKCTVEPIGVDLKNECGPALTCLGTCGGDGSCIGAGTGTMCARNRCVSASTGAGPAYCASPGAKCNVSEAVPFSCSPFICEPAFGACRTTCASSNDCANGFVCDVPSKTCIAAPTPESAVAASGDEGGGCGCSVPGRRGTAGLLASTILALILFGRRRSVPKA